MTSLIPVFFQWDDTNPRLSGQGKQQALGSCLVWSLLRLGLISVSSLFELGFVFISFLAQLLPTSLLQLFAPSINLT